MRRAASAPSSTSQGSGGTLTGVGRYLRERDAAVRLYAVEPAECALLARREWGPHGIEGIGDGFVPRNLDVSPLTGVITTTTEESIEAARRLAAEEGHLLRHLQRLQRGRRAQAGPPPSRAAVHRHHDQRHRPALLHHARSAARPSTWTSPSASTRWTTTPPGSSIATRAAGRSSPRLAQSPRRPYPRGTALRSPPSPRRRLMKTLAMVLAAVLSLLAGPPAGAQGLPTAKAEEVGLSSERLDRIGADPARRRRARPHPRRRRDRRAQGTHRLLETVGFRDKTAGAPMPPDAIFRIASMTKPLVSVADHDALRGRPALPHRSGVEVHPRARQRQVGIEKSIRSRQDRVLHGAGGVRDDDPGSAPPHVRLHLRQPRHDARPQALPRAAPAASRGADDARSSSTGSPSCRC